MKEKKEYSRPFGHQGQLAQTGPSIEIKNILCTQLPQILCVMGFYTVKPLQFIKSTFLKLFNVHVLLQKLEGDFVQYSKSTLPTGKIWSSFLSKTETSFFLWFCETCCCCFYRLGPLFLFNLKISMVRNSKFKAKSFVWLLVFLCSVCGTTQMDNLCQRLKSSYTFSIFSSLCVFICVIVALCVMESPVVERRLEQSGWGDKKITLKLVRKEIREFYVGLPQ